MLARSNCYYLICSGASSSVIANVCILGSGSSPLSYLTTQSITLAPQLSSGRKLVLNEGQQHKDIMNFASNLIASAEKAAAAAQNFKGFDEMAEEDEYIHSDGLNVKKYTDEEASNVDVNQQQQQQQQQPTHSTDEYSTTEPTWSLLDRRPTAVVSSASTMSPPRQQQQQSPLPPPPPAAAASSNQIQSRQSKSSEYYFQQQPPQQQQQQQPYLSVVADALENGSKASDRRSSGYDTDNEGESSHHHALASSSSSSSSSSHESDLDSDDDDDDDDDPILSSIRQSKQKQSMKKDKQKKRQKDFQTSRKDRHGSREQKNRRHRQHGTNNHHNPKDKRNKRGTHRFMDDVPDAAILLVDNNNNNNNSNSYVLEMERTALAENEDSIFMTTPLSSLKNWMTKSLQRTGNAGGSIAAKATTSFLKLGPLSRRGDPQAASNRNKNSMNGPKNNNKEDDFQIVSSSNVLGDDELAALAQLNSNSQQASSWCSVRCICRKARENPRETFIVFTLLFAMYAWFFPRK